MKKTLLILVAVLCSIGAFAISPIAGSSNVCVGSTISLTDATTGGTWSTSSSAIGTIDASGALTGIGAGVVTVTYTVGGPYVTMAVTVDPLPAPISGDTSLCYGWATVSMTDVTTGGTWSVGSSTVAAITSAGLVSHIGTCTGGCGSATVTYTLPTGCAVNKVVHVLPIAVLYTPSMCIGGTATCGGTPSGGTWTSSNPAVATITPFGFVTGLTAGTTLLSYTLKGCTMAPLYTVSGPIASHYVNNVADTFCNGPDFFISSCTTSSAYNVTTHFGDGTSNNTAYGSGTSAHVFHSYTAPGTYLVKQVVYDGTTPKDSVSFSYEYFYCRTLPIKLFNDKNYNCYFDNGDSYNHLPVTVRVDSSGIPVDTISATSGLYYKAYGAPGTIYSFSIIHMPAGVTQACSSSTVIYDTIAATVNTYVAKYFALTCSSTASFDLSLHTSRVFGKHHANCVITVDNDYCTIAPAILTMNISPKFNYTSAYPAPSTVTAHTISWNLDTIYAASTFPTSINVNMDVPGTWLMPGDTVHSAFSISPTTGDTNPANNNSETVDTVRSSYDPNAIEVSPGGYITAGTQLEYTIHFENTGNDTAHNIYVMDTLSDYVDVHSMQIISASAQMNIAKFTSGGHNIVKFDFPGINLLDSSHHNQCDGMFMFNINTKTGLAPGTSIFNHAGIFFDDNPVVMTNTVENIIKYPSSFAQLQIAKVKLYPNPARGEITITIAEGAYDEVVVTNAMAQVLQQLKMDKTSHTLDISQLTPGLYYITARGRAGSTVQKFIKE